MNGHEESPTEAGSDVSEVFADLPGDLATWLEDELRTLRVAPGAVIVTSGDPAEELFVIVDGEVEVVAEDADEVPRQRRVLRAGQFFGEVGLLHGTPRNATVRALGPVRLLRLPRAAFERTLTEAPETARTLMQLARKRTGTS
jgi:CRP-like cAMP-binding protein